MTANRTTAEVVLGQPSFDASRAHVTPTFLSVVATLILSGIVIAMFPLRYETNDDVGMHLTAAGVFYGVEPSEHLVFTNIALGYPLSRLYRLAPDVPWYGLYHILAVTGSAIAINALLLSISRSHKLWALLSLHFFAAIAPCLISIQFTKSAFLATEAGLLTLLAPWFLEKSVSRYWIVAGIPLMLLGAAIRFDAFLLALIAMAPIVVWAAWQRSFRLWKPVVVPLLASLVCCGLLQSAHQAYYAASPGWRDFYEFNQYRHQIVTRNAPLQYVEKTKLIMDAVGWSPADYLMLKNWFCSDTNIFSTAKLQQFAQGIAQLESGHDSSGQVLKRLHPSIATVCLLACIAAFQLILHGWPARLTAAGAFVFSTLLAVAISATTQYMPDRVLYCLFLPSVLMGVLAAGKEVTAPNAAILKPRPWVGLIAALIAVTFAAAAWIDQARVRHDLEDNAAAALDHIKLRSDVIFVDWGGAFQTQLFVHPLGSLDALRPVRCISLGWGLRSPISDSRMRELGIEDLPQALLTREDIVLVCFRGMLEILAQYLCEHEEAEAIDIGFIHQGDERVFGSVVRIRRAEQRISP